MKTLRHDINVERLLKTLQAESREVRRAAYSFDLDGRREYLKGFMTAMTRAIEHVKAWRKEERLKLIAVEAKASPVEVQGAVRAALRFVKQHAWARAVQSLEKIL